jgi:hypothetical protein
MRRARVRRLPVVGPGRTVVGMLSLNDIILALGSDPTLESAAVVETLKAICARQAEPVAISVAVTPARSASAPDGSGRDGSPRAGRIPPPPRRRKQGSQGRAS